jgi:hypothetical protein
VLSFNFQGASTQGVRCAVWVKHTSATLPSNRLLWLSCSCCQLHGSSTVRPAEVCIAVSLLSE